MWPPFVSIRFVLIYVFYGFIHRFFTTVPRIQEVLVSHLLAPLVNDSATHHLRPLDIRHCCIYSLILMIRTKEIQAIRAFSTPTVSRLSGIPTATINHWAATKLIAPSVRGSTGQRATRYWSTTDLIQIRAVRALRQAGCPLQRLRKIRKLLDGCGNNFANQRLIWNGHDVLIVTETGRLESALNRPGQGMFSDESDNAQPKSKPAPGEEFDIKVSLPLAQMHALATDQLAQHSESIDMKHLEKLRRKRVKRRMNEMQPSAQTSRSL